MRIGDIADQLGYWVGGDRHLEVRPPRYAMDAGEEDLAVARTPEEAEKTRARAVLLRRGIVPEKTLLYCPDNPRKGGIYAALVKVVELFVQAGEAPDYGKVPEFSPLPGFPGVFAGKSVSIGPGAAIWPNVTIGDNVRIGAGAVIKAGANIGSGVTIGENAVIENGASIGSAAFFHYRVDSVQHVFRGIGGVIIGDNAHIGANSVIQRGTLSDTVIGNACAIGSLVVIGHDAVIGENCLIVSQTGIAGQVRMETGAAIYGQVGIADRVVIGAHATVMAKSRVSRNIPRGVTVSGLYNRPHKTELRLRARLERLLGEKPGA